MVDSAVFLLWGRFRRSIPLDPVADRHLEGTLATRVIRVGIEDYSATDCGDPHSSEWLSAVGEQAPEARMGEFRPASRRCRCVFVHYPPRSSASAGAGFVRDTERAHSIILRIARDVS